MLICGCCNRITAAHIIGRGTDLEIMVVVENHGEDAFNTKLFVTLPPGVSFRNKAAVSAVSEIGVGLVLAKSVDCCIKWAELEFPSEGSGRRRRNV